MVWAFGPFDGYRKEQIHRLKVSSKRATFSGLRITFPTQQNQTPTWSVQPQSLAPIDHGAWHEWRFRLLGADHSQTVEVVLDDGRIIPAFRHQEYRSSRPHGPSFYAIRLRPDEVKAETIRIRVINSIANPEVIWESPFQLMRNENEPVQTSTVKAEPQSTWPIPLTTAQTTWHMHAHDGVAHRRYGEIPQALAPILRWDANWPGFKGPWVSNHTLAHALDRKLESDELHAIDLLPQFLGEEQGIYRFGLNPFHLNQEGIGKIPTDIIAKESEHRFILHHARAIIARGRAAPGLDQWQVGLSVSSDDSQDLSMDIKHYLNK